MKDREEKITRIARALMEHDGVDPGDEYEATVYRRIVRFVIERWEAEDGDSLASVRRRDDGRTVVLMRPVGTRMNIYTARLQLLFAELLVEESEERVRKLWRFFPLWIRRSPGCTVSYPRPETEQSGGVLSQPAEDAQSQFTSQKGGSTE